MLNLILIRRPPADMSSHSALGPPPALLSLLIWRLQPCCSPRSSLVAPPLALAAPLLHNLLHRNLGRVAPLFTQLTYGHEDLDEDAEIESGKKPIKEVTDFT